VAGELAIMNSKINGGSFSIDNSGASTGSKVKISFSQMNGLVTGGGITCFNVHNPVFAPIICP
jgi:hypothetical protein